MSTAMEAMPAANILIVDDTAENLQVLNKILRKQGYRVRPALSGDLALQGAQNEPPDLILLDITMPGMNGYQVCERLKADERLKQIPVIFISALSETLDKVKAFAVGGVDYITKPFQVEEVQARVETHLTLYRLQNSLLREVAERRRAEERALAYAERARDEEEKAEALLLNILPSPIAARLKSGEVLIADDFAEASVLFADIVEFTAWAARTPAAQVVRALNAVFSAFDRLVERHGLEKIKTVGDAYVAAAGVPMPRPDHARAAAKLGLDMLAETTRLRASMDMPLHIRVGISSGPVVAGVIGTKKFSYDLWGDTVNTASRMATSGLVDSIQLSPTAYAYLSDQYSFQERDEVDVKGKGKLRTYILR